MPIAESDFARLRIPRVAALATSAWPAWLWSTDGSRLLWANAAGAAIFGIGNAAQIGKAALAHRAPLTAQIAALAATLPTAGQERLERLRGFGMGIGRALTCACSRLPMGEGNSAVLVAATEPAGPLLPLNERVRRLFEGTEPVAAFAPDGALVYASAAARKQLGERPTLSALGLESLAAKAFATGCMSGAVRLTGADVEVTAASLGQDESRVLMLTLPQAAAGREFAQAAGEASGPVRELAANAEATTPQQEPVQPEPDAERRHPLRFVWHMDAEGRFAIGSDEFVALVGPRTIAACGRLWSEIAAELKLDPDNDVGRAIATRETWSGISISWPVDESSERLPIELSGLPVFDRARAFCGYRGFGVCRDIARINQLARRRRSRPIGFAPALQTSVAAPSGAPAAAAAIEAAASSEAAGAANSEIEFSPGEDLTAGRAPAAAANVVPFRGGPEARPPSLSPVERSAFRELAQELAARLGSSQPETLAAAEAVAPTGLVVAESSAMAASALAEQHRFEAPPQPVSGERMLLDRMPAGVLVFRNDLLLYANRHFLELSGYEGAQALAAAGGLHALFAEPATDVLPDNDKLRQLSILTRNGDKVAVEGRLFTVGWNGTSALAMILTGVQAEERLRATALALEAAQNQICDLTADLKRESLRTATSKADFLARISHEIRTPLNSIIGFAEVILAERFGAIGNDRYREYLKDMQAAGTHLLSLVNDLLDLSRIEAGQFDLTFAAVDLNDLTRECVDIMQPQANRARIIIRSALAPVLPRVTADARSLRQIVVNLLANAIKLTGPGGQVIVSSAVAEDGAPVLRVRDTGAGMRQADIEMMLDPLHQTAAAADWKTEGRGLTLPLTRALAEANRATFSIKSAPNTGMLVEITFAPNGSAH